ncbi:MAG: PaaX family transcriptional regulator C-terminal domain-containing protein [Arenibacterium sp.]
MRAYVVTVGIMSDPIAPLVQALHAQGRLRVWSLIITIFGDLVQHRGGEISTARLGLLLDRIGVERGALRTALSRLGRDGWVSSTRQGRSSLYRLSSEGLRRFAPATSRIYAPPPPAHVTEWVIDIHLTASGAKDIHLRPAVTAGGASDLRLTGRLDHISAGFRQSLLDPVHMHALEFLGHDLKNLARVDITEPLDAAAARTLLIHRWRRIVLRYDDVLPDLMPMDAPLRDPRAQVADAYRRLTPATEAWLGSKENDLSPMPAAAPSFITRFAPRDQA